MTYERHGKWVCLMVIVIMTVILLNSQSCAKLILKYNDTVTTQEGGINFNTYHVAERPE